MDKVPQIIHDFSKTNHPEERSRIARDILEERAAYRTYVNNLAEYLRSQNEEATILESRLSSELDINSEIQEHLDAIESSVLVRRVLAYAKKKRLLQQQDASQSVAGLTVKELDAASSNIRLTETTTKESVLPYRSSIEQKLADFYEQETVAWESLPYSKEEVMNLFSPEYLSQLGLDDYLALLRRFPCQFVTHVTRQGIRDHNEFFHNTGIGSFHTCFTDILMNNRSIQSFLGKHLVSGIGKESIREMFDGPHFHITERAAFENWLHNLTENDSTGGYADRAAIHTATEGVADAFYGAEHGNEIFVAFPSQMVASQYLFAGNLVDGDGREGVHMNNDSWIWVREHRGIPIDAGVTFIPANCPVDPATGSRYATDNNRTPLTTDVGDLIPASNTISSHDYWEQYFTANPGLRPHKLAYYQGDNPTAALHDWKDENNLTKWTDDLSLGFPEHQIKSEDAGTVMGVEEFKQLALEMSAERFPEQ